MDDPCTFGIVETDSGSRARRFVEKLSSEQVTINWINAGIYILEPEVLQYILPGRHWMFEHGLFPLLLVLSERVYGYPVGVYWLDMGTPEKYFQLNCDLLISKTKSALVEDLSQNEIRCGKDVMIPPK